MGTNGENMQKPTYKKITFDFPAEEYVYLKMACAKQGVSMKDFITHAVKLTIEDYENKLDLAALQESKEDTAPFIAWDEMEKKLGWNEIE